MVIITLGLIVGFLLAQPSIESAVDDLKEAREDIQDEMVSMKNTDIELVSASQNNTTKVLNVTIRNGGSTVFSTSELAILINGTIISPRFDPAGYLYPSQTTRAEIRDCYRPIFIKVVGPWGISKQVSNESITR